MVAILLWASTEFQLAEPRGLPASTHARTGGKGASRPTGRNGETKVQEGKVSKMSHCLSAEAWGCSALPSVLSHVIPRSYGFFFNCGKIHVTSN